MRNYALLGFVLVALVVFSGCIENHIRTGTGSDIVVFNGTTGYSAGDNAPCNITCSSCDDCEDALNNATAGYEYVCLDTNISTTANCIYDPSGFSGKTFDCRGFTIDGDDDAANYAFYLDGKPNNVIKNCVITDFDYYVIRTYDSDNVLIYNNTFSSNAGGIYLEYDSDNNNITGNTITLGEERAIEIDGQDAPGTINNLIINNNNISNNVRNGISLWYVNSVIIDNNTINFNGESGGVIFNDAIYVNITNNEINGNLDGGSNGITCEITTSYCYIINNIVHDNVYYGINCDGDFNQIVNNSIDNSTYGLDITPGTDTAVNNTVTGNNITSNSGYGISIYSAINNTFSDNNISNNGQNGIQFADSATSNVFNNNEVCSNNQNAGAYYDINDSDSNTGDDNTCNTTSNWNDTGTTGCTYVCDSCTNNLTNTSWVNYANSSCYSNSTIDLNWSLIEYDVNDCGNVSNTTYYMTNSTSCIYVGDCNCSSCDECEDELNSACTYVNLTADITDYAGTCIDNPVNFTDKTFDCQGFTIDGARNSDTIGIFLDGKYNNTIYNCTVTEFVQGIYLNNSYNNSILYSTFNDNEPHGGASGYGYGIYLLESDNNTIYQTTANNNQFNGLHIFTGSDGNVVYENTFNSNKAKGIYAISNDNTIYLNNISLNLGGGIVLFTGSDNTTAYNNTICDNTGYDAWDGGTNNNKYNNSCDNIIGWHEIDTYYGCMFGCDGTAKNVCECSSCDECEYYLNSSSCSQVNLTANITGVSGTCISNPTDYNNVILDCQGYTISGDGLYTGDGIQLTAKENNTIQNCKIENFRYGISLTNAFNTTVFNNSILSNNASGVYLDPSYNNTIIQNNISNNNLYGIELDQSYNNSILNNTCFNNSVGISLVLSLDNLLENNSVNNNTAWGIALTTVSDTNTLITNEVNYNVLFNIYIDNSDGTTLTSNAGNGSAIGLVITNSILNTLDSNTFCSNGLDVWNDSDITGSGVDDICDTTTTWYESPFLGCTWLCNGSPGPLPCVNIIVNTSWVNVENSSCYSNNTMELTWNLTEYDSAYCGNFTNVTYQMTNWTSCVNCNCTTCDECEDDLNEVLCTQVNLTTSISGYTDTCINNPVNFSNKIFDCLGNTIDGDDSLFHYGIYLYTKENNTIQNCIINDFYFGILLYSSSNNNTLINDTVNSNTIGVYLSISSNNNITNNVFNSNMYQGIILYYSSNNNSLTNNTANLNRYGIYLYSSSNNNTIVNNTVNLNSINGIYSTSSDNNTFTENIACNNLVDIYQSFSTNTGDDNNCSTYDEWNDTGTVGCTYTCSCTPDLEYVDCVSVSNGTCLANFSFEQVWNCTVHDLNNCTANTTALLTNYSTCYTCDCDNCSNCTSQLENDQCGIINVTSNMSSNGSCIYPTNTSYKKLYCNGFTLTGNTSGIGIFFNSSSEMTLKDCIITNFSVGMNLTNTTYSNITNNTICSNTIDVYDDIYSNSYSSNTCLFTTGISGSPICTYTCGNYVINGDECTMLVNSTCEDVNIALADVKCKTVIVLSDNLTSNGSCINMTASTPKILDCAGNYISNNFTGTGVYVNSTSSMTIQNCIILDFETGINSTYDSPINIYNVTSCFNTNYDMYINSTAASYYSLYCDIVSGIGCDMSCNPLTFTKTINLSNINDDGKYYIDENTSVTYTYTVCNNGQFTATDIGIEDSNLGTVNVSSSSISYPSSCRDYNMSTYINVTTSNNATLTFTYFNRTLNLTDSLSVWFVDTLSITNMSKTISTNEVNRSDMPTNTTFTVNISFCGYGNRTLIGLLPTEVDIVFSIDDSGSMCKTYSGDPLYNDELGKRFSETISFIENNLDSSKDFAGALIWSSYLKDSYPLSNANSFDNVSERIHSWDPSTHTCGGSTDLAVGLEEAIELVLLGNGTKIIVYLSDGTNDCFSCPNKDIRMNAAITNATTNNITVYTIGLGTKVNTSILKNISSRTGGKYYYISDINSLAGIYSSIAEKLYQSTMPMNITIMDVLTSNVTVDEDTVEMSGTTCDITPTVEIINQSTYITAKNVDCTEGLNSTQCVYLSYNASMVECGLNLDVELPTASIFDGSKVEWVTLDEIEPLGEVAITQLEINVTCPVVNFTLSKTTDKTTVGAGTNVVYNFTLVNTGNVNLDLDWEDTNCDSWINACATTVGLDENVTCSCSSVIQTSTTNTVIVNGSFAEYSLLQYDSVTVNVGGIYLTKDATPKIVTLGQQINYTFIIENVGTYPISLSGLTITDDHLGTINLSNCIAYYGT